MQSKSGLLEYDLSCYRQACLKILRCSQNSVKIDIKTVISCRISLFENSIVELTMAGCLNAVGCLSVHFFELRCNLRRIVCQSTRKIQMTEICPQDTYWMTVWCLYRVWSTKNLLCCPCLLFTSLVIVIRVLAISLMSELKNSFKTTMQRMPNPVLFYFLCEKRSMDRMSLGNSYVQWKWNVIWIVKWQNKKILYKMFVIFIHRIIHVILLDNCRNGLMLNYWRCWQLHRNVVIRQFSSHYSKILYML